MDTWQIFFRISWSNLLFFLCLHVNAHTMWILTWPVCVHTKCSQLQRSESLHETSSAVLFLTHGVRTTISRSTDSRRDWWLFSLWLAVFLRSSCCFWAGLMDWVAGQWARVSACGGQKIRNRKEEWQTERQKEVKFKAVDVCGRTLSQTHKVCVEKCDYWRKFLFSMFKMMTR